MNSKSRSLLHKADGLDGGGEDGSGGQAPPDYSRPKCLKIVTSSLPTAVFLKAFSLFLPFLPSFFPPFLSVLGTEPWTFILCYLPNPIYYYLLLLLRQSVTKLLC